LGSKMRDPDKTYPGKTDPGVTKAPDPGSATLVAGPAFSKTFVVDPNPVAQNSFLLKMCKILYDYQIVFTHVKLFVSVQKKFKISKRTVFV
jgi:hypothetical protein